MKKTDFQTIYAPKLEEICPSRVRFDEPLAAHTTFKIGGPAFAWVEPADAQQLSDVCKLCRDAGLPFAILGGGSNMLCETRGFDGVVIHLAHDAFNEVSLEILEDGQHGLVAGAACTLRAVVESSLQAGYVNLGFLGGIPGTLGGAVAMNAGSRTEWISRVVHRIEAVSLETFEVVVLNADDIEWGYRTSSLRDTFIITRAWISPLIAGDAEKTRADMKFAFERRKNTQPLAFPNAGSIFKNPEGASSGALIESLGLKGFSIGGAQVSEQHANFIVNTGGATSDDVRSLIAMIQEKVYETYGLRLTTEIRFLSE